jgi:hypothetical protein
VLISSSVVMGRLVFEPPGCLKKPGHPLLFPGILMLSNSESREFIVMSFFAFDNLAMKVLRASVKYRDRQPDSQEALG